MQKIKQLTAKNSKTALKCIEQGIDFNLNMGRGVYITYMGGLLSKLDKEQQFIYINGRGWVGI